MLSGGGSCCNIAITLIVGAAALSGVNECNRLFTSTEPDGHSKRSKVGGLNTERTPRPGCAHESSKSQYATSLLINHQGFGSKDKDTTAPLGDSSCVHPII